MGEVLKDRKLQRANKSFGAENGMMKVIIKDGYMYIQWSIRKQLLCCRLEMRRDMAKKKKKMEGKIQGKEGNVSSQQGSRKKMKVFQGSMLG